MTSEEARRIIAAWPEWKRRNFSPPQPVTDRPSKGNVIVLTEYRRRRHG